MKSTRYIYPGAYAVSFTLAALSFLGGIIFWG